MCMLEGFSNISSGSPSVHRFSRTAPCFEQSNLYPIRLLQHCLFDVTDLRVARLLGFGEDRRA